MIVWLFLENVKNSKLFFNQNIQRPKARLHLINRSKLYALRLIVIQTTHPDGNKAIMEIDYSPCTDITTGPDWLTRSAHSPHRFWPGNRQQKKPIHHYNTHTRTNNVDVIRAQCTTWTCKCTALFYIICDINISNSKKSGDLGDKMWA